MILDDAKSVCNETKITYTYSVMVGCKITVHILSANGEYMQPDTCPVLWVRIKAISTVYITHNMCNTYFKTSLYVAVELCLTFM